MSNQSTPFGARTSGKRAESVARKYVELRAHTAFSFNDGSVTPERLIERARELGYSAIGITDTADLGGIARAANACRKYIPKTQVSQTEKAKGTLSSNAREPSPDIRIIAGAELRVDGYPAAFLARTPRGYQNLASLVTASRVGTWRTWDKDEVAKERGQPSVTWAQVMQCNEGLHMLTGPSSGEIAQLIHNGRKTEAARKLAQWKDVFQDRLAVEVQMHYVGGHEAALAAGLIALAQWCGVPWVVTNDPRYIDDQSRLVHDMLIALRYGYDIETAQRAGVLHPNGEWKLISPEDMRRRWMRAEQGIEESARIASECDFDISWMRPPMPVFPLPNGATDEAAFLRARVYDGAHVRWGVDLSIAQREQIDHELRVINALGFAGFFLVMWDAVRYAKSVNILCQGRGSAANSTAAYCLGITAVDPVKHGLLFERFLSEVRTDGKTEPPDIDVDFEHDRREEVLDYVYGKYQRENAAITCTVQTYRAPNAVRDAMRAFGYPETLTTSISKRLHRYDPADAATHMQEKYAKEAGLVTTDARVKGLFKAIAGFEGLPRIRSTHVGGFVLSSAPLGNWLPIEQTTMGRTIVQADKDDLDIICVPKFDFLGLGGLSMIRRAFDAIEVRTGDRPEMYTLPQDDKPTYDLISRGETVGTFQIESRAQISSIVHTKPDRLYDIVVQVALIRPGPIQAKFVKPYTMRRRGLEQVTYLHPKLEPILKRTQGIPIFQEQAMSIAMALGGYTGGEADELRRTMGNIRKQQRLSDALDRLREAMMSQGIDIQLADHICQDLMSFANYGFPESHAWSFALIAYATAYLKQHYPTEFFVGILNAWPMGFYSPATLIHEARRSKVIVRSPCLKHGNWECTTESSDPNDAPGTKIFFAPDSPLNMVFDKNAILHHASNADSISPQASFPSSSPNHVSSENSPGHSPYPALRIGWRFVRGMGELTLNRLREAHEAANHQFASIEDVVIRARLTRAECTSLALADAFSAWEPNRHRAAWEALRASSDKLPLAPAHHDPHNPPRMNRDELIALDYFATGTSIHGHPMRALRAKLRNKGVKDSRDLSSMRNRQPIMVAGLVVVRQRPQTANGTIFLLLEDEHGFINVIVPNKLVEPNEQVVKQAQFILIRGRVEREGASISVLGAAFKKLEAGILVHDSRDFH